MKTIITLFLSILLLSCNKQKSIAEDAHHVISASISSNNSSLELPKLQGIWYTYNPGFEAKELLFYKKRQQENDGLEYEVTFKKNGEISFKTLTRELICGVGILELDKGTYKMHHETFLFLRVSGHHALESSFETELEYEILPSKKGILHLRLSQTLKHCYERFNRDMYLDQIEVAN